MSSLSSLGGDLKPVERGNIHLTLKFLGNVSSSKLEEVKSALAQVTLPPFSLEIKGAGAFPNLKRMNVIWVGVGEGWSQVELIFLRSSCTQRIETDQLAPTARDNPTTGRQEDRSKRSGTTEDGWIIAGDS